MDYKRIINRDFIGVIEEEEGLLKYKEIEISYPRDLVEKLEAMGIDGQYTILDVQNLFCRYYPKESIRNLQYDFLFPNSYKSTYNTLSHAPKFYNQKDFPANTNTIDIGGLVFEEYRFYPCGFKTAHDYEQFISQKKKVFFNQNRWYILEEFMNLYDRDHDNYAEEIEELKKIKESNFFYSIKIEALRKNFNDKIDQKTKCDLIELKNNIRMFFVKGCIRFIHAICYDHAKKSLLKNVLMYSSEKIGWTTYKYQISKIERIEFHSNFGFGSKSYSYCNLFYKDVPILPYVDAVKYVSVDWKQIVYYTRSYEPIREVCWERSFDFVVDVSNLIKKNPEQFIDEFIVGEIREMLIRLNNVLKSTSWELKDYFDKQDIENRKTTFVWNTGLYLDAYSIFPEEAKDSIIIEKISGCLCFLDNMRNLNEFIPIIGLFIDELISLNRQIIPLMDKYLYKLPIEIQQNKKELHELAESISEIESRMKKCIGLYPNLDKALKLKDKTLNDYLEKQPLIAGAYQEYTDLSGRLVSLDRQKKNKSKHLELRRNFLTKIEECKKRIITLLS